MKVLKFDGVSKRFTGPRRESIALDDVSFAVEAGEVVAVWGGHGSGRTTLLRVAAGIDQPDRGTVVFAGIDLRTGAEAVTAHGLAYVQPRLVGPQGQMLIERLTVPLVVRGASRARAWSRVEAALAATGVADCAQVRVGDLDATETARVGLAQALLSEPKLILVDEPTATVPLTDRDGVLALLRKIADTGVSVLMTAGDAIGLSGVDRALTISGGRLRANVSAERATVTPLRPVAGA